MFNIPPGPAPLDSARSFRGNSIDSRFFSAISLRYPKSLRFPSNSHRPGKISRGIAGLNSLYQLAMHLVKRSLGNSRVFRQWQDCSIYFHLFSAFGHCNKLVDNLKCGFLCFSCNILFRQVSALESDEISVNCSGSSRKHSCLPKAIWYPQELISQHSTMALSLSPSFRFTQF